MGKQKTTLNKETLTMHLIVSQGMDKAQAAETVNTIFKLFRQTLMDEGKIVIHKVGTLEMSVLASRTTKIFGEQRDLPARFKVRFRQSKSLALLKSPIMPSEQGDEIASIANMLTKK